MNVIQRIKKTLNEPLKTFKIFERIFAAICIAIPPLLWLTDTGHPGLRSSISYYAYMTNSYIFGMLLCMASMLFIFNGAVYFRNENKFGLNRYGKWYNVALGVSLLCIIIFPTRQFTTLHLILGGVFFLGNALVIGIFHKRKDRTISIALAVLTIASFVLNLFHLFSLFWAEWLSLIVIGIHFILESKGILSLGFEERLHPNADNQNTPIKE